MGEEPATVRELLGRCSDVGLTAVIALALEEMERWELKPRGVLKMGREWGVVTGEYDPPGERARRN